jgi:hypothetical protein
MNRLKGLFAKKKDIIKPRLLSFKAFQEYVYEPSERIRSMNLPENDEKEIRVLIRRRLETNSMIEH